LLSACYANPIKLTADKEVPTAAVEISQNMAMSGDRPAGEYQKLDIAEPIGYGYTSIRSS
jgi:hypothetical protein